MDEVNHKLADVYFTGKSNAMSDRYMLVSDNSGHTYTIPISKRDNWDDFMSLDEDDPKSWDVPEYAVIIDGDFTFCDPSNLK